MGTSQTFQINSQCIEMTSRPKEEKKVPCLKTSILLYIFITEKQKRPVFLISSYHHIVLGTDTVIHKMLELLLPLCKLLYWALKNKTKLSKPTKEMC